MKQQVTTDNLIAALTAEHAALLNFVALLESEQSMLLANLTDELLAISEKKSSAAISLDKLAKSNRAMLQENIPQLSIDSIQEWIGKQSQRGLEIWKKARALANRSQQLNRTNGDLIQMKLRHNQQSLSVLSNAVNSANLYGPDGQTNFSTGFGRSLGNG